MTSGSGTGATALGLYVHVPFCRHLCGYCNFTRGLLDEPLKRAYVDALVAEIRRAGAGEAADTVFFGGGTPSLLEPEEIDRILTACRDAFTVASDAEVTIETNPESATEDRLRGFHDAGVTRISFGIQSFRDEELTRLGRAHDAHGARAALYAARTAGFDNVSADLMMWLPQQTLADWLASVDTLVALEPDHASLYLLELYPNSPLREDMARAGWSLAPDEDAARMYLDALSMLDRAGYQQYEISNVARLGRQARHNLKYWQDGDWLGFGCGAHSTRDGVRWRNVAPTADYVARMGDGREIVVERRVLTPRQRLEEALFTGLRLVEGVDLRELERRYGWNVWEEYGASLEPYAAAGLVRHEAGRLRLTREGMLVSQEVLSAFV